MWGSPDEDMYWYEEALEAQSCDEDCDDCDCEEDDS